MTQEQDDLVFFADDELQPTSTPKPATISQENEPWHILVVDDDSAVHNLTKFILRKFEFEGRPIVLTQAFSAAEAIQILRTEHHFALILLDVVMETRSAGFDVVRFIRQEQKNSFVRIVLRTGQPGDAPEYEVIQKYDINDYKSKTELTDIKLLTTITTSLRSYRDLLTIEETRLLLEKNNAHLETAYRDLHSAQEELLRTAALKRDIQLAAEVQRSLFPTVFPDCKEYEFAAASEPAMDVGGDLCDIIQIDDTHIALLIADVSGKGIHAAIFMAVCRTLFLTQTLRSAEPSAIVNSVNELLLRASTADKFVTAFLAVLDTQHHTLSYVCAGHEPATIIRSNGSVQALRNQSRFLGLLEHPDVTSETVPFFPGDILFMVSDGVFDTRSDSGSMFGQERLREFCTTQQGKTATQIVNNILSTLQQFRGNAPMFDDTTIVACSRVK